MSNFDTTTRLAKYIVDFTNRADGQFKVNIDGYGSLIDLDYDNHSERWGSFNGTITYSIFKTSIEITVEYPDYADYSHMNVKISSKKLGVDKYVDTTRELKAELKNIAEKLIEFIGPEGSNAFADII